ncbi:Putative protein without homology [Lacticaseibacillus rhamnosus GG]|nr:Putative protein without homology [Lacticaseibacillus rhamnosus GG]
MARRMVKPHVKIFEATAAQKWQIAILSLSNDRDGYFLRLFSHPLGKPVFTR